MINPSLLRSANEPLEKGVVLKVHPLGSSVPSSLSTAIPRLLSLSQWWVESSHELHDPTRKDSHVVSRTFTLASNLHSTVDHISPFPLLGRQISAGEVQWALPSSKTPPLQYKGSHSKVVPRMFRYFGEGAAKHYDEVTARNLFCAISSFKFHRLGLFKGHREILVDDDKLLSSYADYFISQRSSYLASRRGSICIVEPYSPHRFGRQFGFNQHIPRELNEDFRTVTLEQVVCFWRRCLRLVTNSKFLIPACPFGHEAPCTKDYMNWWARRSDGFFLSSVEQPIGNVNPSKIRLKIKQPNEVVEPVKRQNDRKPSLGISEATDESLGGACVDKAHSPKRGPSCIVSTLQDGEVTKSKDASDSERNSGNLDSHWRRKRQRDNPNKNLDHEGVI
nr:hypothetical protein CFP56_08754 [Quercus suber]